MFRNILVPLDGTPFGEQALPVTMAVARRTGAHVHLVQVRGKKCTEPCAVEAARRGGCGGRAWVALTRLADELTAAGVRATPALLHGPTVETLAGYATDVRADLVVIATHGRGPLSRVVFGSVADPLVRRLTAPTLLVRNPGPGTGHGLPAPARHLLIALDGTAEAEAVLPAALELGAATGADFTLLRVVDPVSICEQNPMGVVVPYTDGAATDRHRAEAAAYLDWVATPLRAAGRVVRTRVTVRPDPAAAILDAAQAAGCNLIALETHGLTGLTRLIIGSVADEVVRGGTTPVLTHSSAVT